MSRQFFDDMYARAESERRIKETSDPDYETQRQARNAQTMKKLRAQRPWESSDLSREEYALRLNMMLDKFSGKNNERKDNPMNTFRPPYHVDFHSERGEVTINVTDADGKDVWYATTETVNELIEGGFLSTKGFAMERSVLDYLRSVGIIPDPSDAPKKGTSAYYADLFEKSGMKTRHDNPIHTNTFEIGRYENGTWLGTLTGPFHSLDEAITAARECNLHETVAVRDVYSRRILHVGKRKRATRADQIHRSNVARGYENLEKIARMDRERKSNPDAERPSYTVIVSNMGTLCDTYDRREAMDYFKSAVEEVSAPRGRASGESVTLMFDGEIIREYQNEFQSHRQGTRESNPTATEVASWVDHYKGSMEKRIDGVPEKSHYVIAIQTTDNQSAFLRVGKGSKFDTDPAKARVYRNSDKANEAATKVMNWLKKKYPAKAKKIKSIGVQPKK